MEIPAKSINFSNICTDFSNHFHVAQIKNPGFSVICFTFHQ